MQNDRDFTEAILVYTNVNTFAFEKVDCLCHAEKEGNKKFWLKKVQAWMAQKKEKILEINLGNCKLY
jgi:hypothetical protein